jgi:hypothetical protein
MADLKLAKLPDRTPGKLTVTISPDLNRALAEYAELYRDTYGESETVAELVPFMLEAFLASDRGFAKARKHGMPRPTVSTRTKEAPPGPPAASSSLGRGT